MVSDFTDERNGYLHLSGVARGCSGGWNTPLCPGHKRLMLVSTDSFLLTLERTSLVCLYATVNLEILKSKVPIIGV